MNTTKQSLGQFLKVLREERAQKLREVESATGISNAYLSQLEGDKIRQPSPIILEKLAAHYRVAYGTLMKLAGYAVPGDGQHQLSSSTLAARLGSVTPAEEDELVDYLHFLRKRRGK
jgi:transcriptional regulator with XRE-family HTH domain